MINATVELVWVIVARAISSVCSAALLIAWDHPSPPTIAPVSSKVAVICMVRKWLIGTAIGLALWSTLQRVSCMDLINSLGRAVSSEDSS
jgi:hypothetical protein